MGAAFLCGITGIQNKTIDNSVAYIESWLKRLKSDNKFVFSAASYAQHAVDYILENQQTVSNPVETQQELEEEPATITFEF